MALGHRALVDTEIAVEVITGEEAEAVALDHALVVPAAVEANDLD